MLLIPAWAGGQDCPSDKAAGTSCSMSAEKQAGKTCPMSAQKQAAKADCCASKAEKTAAAGQCAKSSAKTDCPKNVTSEGWFAAKTGCAGCATMTSH